MRRFDYMPLALGICALLAACGDDGAEPSPSDAAGADGSGSGTGGSASGTAGTGAGGNGGAPIGPGGVVAGSHGAVQAGSGAAQAGSGGAAGAAGGASAAGNDANDSARFHCAPGDSGTWEQRHNCDGAQVEALQAVGLGPTKAFQYGVYYQELAVPMTAGMPYAFSIGISSLDGLPINVELWGATAVCGGELELLGAQTMGAAVEFSGVACTEMHPTKAFTHLLTVIRSDDGFTHGAQFVCPTGSCSNGTQGLSEEWPGKSLPFCDPDEPEQCEACADLSGCDAPVFTGHGDGTVSSSCCDLEWTQASGPDGFYDLTEAQAYCGSLTLDGGGFRLPTLAELLTLVDASAAAEPLIALTAFPDTVATGYWSSTDYRHFDETAGVDFGNGRVAHDDPTRTMRVRCVR